MKSYSDNHVQPEQLEELKQLIAANADFNEKRFNKNNLNLLVLNVSVVLLITLVSFKVLV